MNKRNIILVVFLIILAGCMPRIYSETGKRFDEGYFDTIQPGKTTKKDLVAGLGDPQQTGVKESGKEMWTYLFLSLDSPQKCIIMTTSPEISHEFMRMTITFDGDKVFEKSYEKSVKKEEPDSSK